MSESMTHEQMARAEIAEVSKLAGANPVKLGILTPLTGPGDSVAGVIVSRGARIGAEYIREQGGILGGRQLDFVLRNDQATAAEEGMARSAVGELAKLAQIDEVAGVFGQWHLRTSKYVSALADKIGIPTFVENGQIDVTSSGYRSIFRQYFSIADRVPLMMDYVASLGFRRIAMLAADTVFGLTTADTIEEYGTSVHGMEFLRFDFPQETTYDLSEQLKAVKDWEPDLIINDGVIRTNYLMIKQAAELGLRPQVPMMVTFGFPTRSHDFWREAGDAGVGIMWAGIQYRPTWDGLTDIGRWFTERYEAMYGGYAPDTTLSAFTDVTILARAIELAGTTEHDAVIEALESHEFDTWRGPLRFERGPEHWHHNMPRLQIMQYQKVGQTFDESAIVYPDSLANAAYVPADALR